MKLSDRSCSNGVYQLCRSFNNPSCSLPVSIFRKNNNVINEVACSLSVFLKNESGVSFSFQLREQVSGHANRCNRLIQADIQARFGEKLVSKRKDHYLGINEACFCYEGKRHTVTLKGYHLDGKEHGIDIGSPSDLLHFLKRKRSELTSLNHYYNNQHLVFYTGYYTGYNPNIPKKYVETGIYFAEHGEKTLFFRRPNMVGKQGVVIGSSDELLMIWNELGRWCEAIGGRKPTYYETTLV